MAERKDDEIMAEYLLKGGKMLQKTCPVCGCPLFEYRKKTFCVVCAEKRPEGKNEAGPAALVQPVTAAQPVAPATAATGLVAPSAPALKPLPEADMLSQEIAGTLVVLCQRIKKDDDPDRCLALMDAVKIGTEALEILRRV
ncbi:MAG: Sjogren's syndrome/scleroderma autoantigen 1 family protein [Methanoregula sp.]|jgi:UPF0148 protein